MLVELKQTFTPKTLVVTPTQRLARYLQQLYADQPAPLIIPLHDWLTRLWEIYLQQTPNPWSCISRWQSSLIWQRLIKKSDLNLLRPNSIINEAQYAWDLLQQWQVPLTQLQRWQQNNESDSGLFALWAEQYADICQQQRWIDEACIANFLLTELKDITAYSEKNIYLYGFDYLTPQLRALCVYLRERGIYIAEYTAPELQTTQAHYFSYTDSLTELRGCAQWAVEQGLLHKEKTLEKPIGIVIPDLSKRWSQVQRIFSETLAGTALEFNIAGGLPLVEYPIIADTLLLLKWITRPLAYVEMSHLIRSVFWQGQSQELTARAQLTLALSDAEYQHISVPALFNFLKKRNIKNCDELVKITTTLLAFQQNCSHKVLPSEWATHLLALFENIDWPNGRTLTSAEYQVWQRGLVFIQEVGSLDTIIKEPVSLRALLTLLQQQSRKIIFQPESVAAPIQVLGLAESSGMVFSALHVNGMTADAWPPEPKPNPFIPITVQRKYEMPNASYPQEYKNAQQLMQKWQQSTSTLIMSYPQQDKGVEYEPTPLWNGNSIIARAAEQSGFILPAKAGIHPKKISLFQMDSRFREKDETELLCARDDVPVSDLYGLPATKMQGGIQLLQDQAECPFRAYAHHRLGLAHNKLEAPNALGTALMRGIIVHRVLHLLWKNLKNQKQLMALADHDLFAQVSETVKRVLHENYHEQLKTNVIPSLYIEVEQERLTQLIMDWLHKEKQRSDFEVYVLEQAVVVILADFALNLRIDRIDTLANGEFLIIDYKISSQTSLSWTQERLTQPQLPLYALSHAKPLAGVVFAQVAGDKVGFNGLVQEAELTNLPKATARSLTATTFPTQLSQWRAQLELLAQEYQQGYAAVTPYPNTDTCNYCDLHLLCRVDHS